MSHSLFRRSPQSDPAAVAEARERFAAHIGVQVEPCPAAVPATAAPRPPSSGSPGSPGTGNRPRTTQIRPRTTCAPDPAHLDRLPEEIAAAYCHRRGTWGHRRTRP